MQTTREATYPTRIHTDDADTLLPQVLRLMHSQHVNRRFTDTIDGALWELLSRTPQSRSHVQDNTALLQMGEYGLHRLRRADDVDVNVLVHLRRVHVQAELVGDAVDAGIVDKIVDLCVGADSLAEFLAEGFDRRQVAGVTFEDMDVLVRGAERLALILFAIERSDGGNDGGA